MGYMDSSTQVKMKSKKPHHHGQNAGHTGAGGGSGGSGGSNNRVRPHSAGYHVISSDNTVFVGNMHPSISEGDLIKLFQPCGEIRNINYMWHLSGPNIGMPRGFAFVEFSNSAEVERACEKMNGKVVCGKDLLVRKADSTDAVKAASKKESSSTSGNIPGSSAGVAASSMSSSSSSSVSSSASTIPTSAAIERPPAPSAGGSIAGAKRGRDETNTQPATVGLTTSLSKPTSGSHSNHSHHSNHAKKKQLRELDDKMKLIREALGK
jgi:RNA recognition motif-containing protein